MPKRLPLTQWKLIPGSCSCKTCQDMCSVPCWPTPQEAQKLIELGYGPKLMAVSRYLNQRAVLVICPAKKGLEGKTGIDVVRKFQCTFQTDDNLCAIHNICKPLEGRLAICKNTRTGREPIDLRDRILLLWDNKDAQNLVRQWALKFRISNCNYYGLGSVLST